MAALSDRSDGAAVLRTDVTYFLPIMTNNGLEKYTREELQKELHSRIPKESKRRGYDVVLSDVLLNMAARVFGVEQDKLTRQRTTGHALDAKCSVSVIMRDRYKFSYPEIATLLGYKDHTAVYHNVNTRHLAALSREDYRRRHKELDRSMPQDLNDFYSMSTSVGIEVSDLHISFTVRKHKDGSITYCYENPKDLGDDTEPEVKAVAITLYMGLAELMTSLCVAHSDVEVVNEFSLRLVRMAGKWKLETSRYLTKEDTSQEMKEIREKMINIADELVK